MQEQEHFANAPIVEATIDLRVTLPEGLTMQRLEEFQQLLGTDYTVKQNLVHAEAAFSESNEPIAVQSHITGFRFVNAEKRKIVQARPDGFAFTLVAPYDSWEPFRDEARLLWDKYRELVQPTGITRVAVRYINQFNIPLATIEIKDYLRTFPEIAADLPQVFEQYFMQVVIPLKEINGTVIINQAIVPPPSAEFTSIILDIDLFRDKDVFASDVAAWEAIEPLRDRKNYIFQACITEKAKELIR